LPSAALKTLAKKKTLDKEEVCRVSKKKQSAKRGFAECFLFYTRQKKIKSFFLEKKEKKKNKKTLSSSQI